MWCPDLSFRKTLTTSHTCVFTLSDPKVLIATVTDCSEGNFNCSLRPAEMNYFWLPLSSMSLVLIAPAVPPLPCTVVTAICSNTSVFMSTYIDNVEALAPGVCEGCATLVLGIDSSAYGQMVFPMASDTLLPIRRTILGQVSLSEAYETPSIPP